MNTYVSKYKKNRFGKYDCPEPGCDRRGKRGMPSPQGLGAHRKWSHSLVVPNLHTLSPFNSIGRKAATPLPRGIDRKAQMDAHANGIATLSVAVSLMALPAVRELSHAQAADVFAAILNTKRDETRGAA